MIPVAYAATGKMAEKASRQYTEFRGVSHEKYEEISKAILGIIKGREMSVFEVKKALKTQVDVSSVLSLMCDQGLLARGKRDKGWKDKNHKYSLFHEYFPNIDLAQTNETEARTRLVQYYLGSFGPVTENDISWWTGLSKVEVREAMSPIRKQLLPVEISGITGAFVMLHTDWDIMNDMGPFRKPTVNLLPTLDPYLMGYKERERYLDYKNYDKVFDRSGNATWTILLDGRVIGVWDFEEDAKPSVKLFFFEEVAEEVLNEIYLKARQIGEFMAEREVQIKQCESMIPLTSRTAGVAMSPLKGC
jgi:hypothetical protein